MHLDESRESRIDDPGVLRELAALTYGLSGTNPRGDQSVAWLGFHRPATACDDPVWSSIGGRRYARWAAHHYGFYSRLVRDFLAPSSRVIDYGCGCGIGSRMLARYAETVIGIDVDERALTFARAQEHDRLVYANCDVLDGPLPFTGFDAVFAVEVLEHVYPDMQDRFIAGLFAALRPSGLLLMTTPKEEIRERPHVGILTTADAESFRGRHGDSIVHWGYLSVRAPGDPCEPGWDPRCAKEDATHYLIAMTAR